MKKKAPQTTESIVPKDLLERARDSVRPDASRPPRPKACVVCGGETAPNSAEGLCWVCRRLKISAWRESDLQAPAQE
jgi:hypothetical protein